MQETQCLQIRAIQEIIFEMGIRSHHSWASGSSKSPFCCNRALSPAVTLQIPGHLVLPPKSSPGVPCLPIHPRSAGEWRPWAHWCLLCSMHKFFSCWEAFLHHPLHIFQDSFQGFLPWASWIGWEVFCVLLIPVSVTHSCICTLVCAQHPEQCPARSSCSANTCRANGWSPFL